MPWINTNLSDEVLTHEKKEGEPLSAPLCRQFQEGDSGSYMCYATNSLGSNQQSLQLTSADRHPSTQPAPGTLPFCSGQHSQCKTPSTAV